MRTGVYGGTFDPIHIGHLIMATLAREELELDQVLWIPAYRPPHKDEQSNQPLSSYDHRLRMVELAIADRPYFSLSTIEGEKDGPSYTYDTLKQLQARRSDTYLFLCGADSLATIDTWHRARDLMQEFTLGVFQRQEYQAQDVKRKLETLGFYFENVRWLDTPVFDVSSTWLRQRLRMGLGVADLIPHSVYNYIKEHGLYV
ncbi:nicotinate (nicotinamide) nucleotide adenylyltransferase [Fodinisporobacter ferrooxydans]|uniref:Probable nicotinate-nucleotide adenylyltransferase n=1 Tax=Fodinisporobacter ferrooxydans TaxID=2901836 RepID=A0ABY4CHH9_9BACL|nr:nicotinate (nicotinamide) nucleotide adenylyltransferase [Alicyclobacillaceae bacterium MYW30-H2]